MSVQDLWLDDVLALNKFHTFKKGSDSGLASLTLLAQKIYWIPFFSSASPDSINHLGITYISSDASDSQPIVEVKSDGECEPEHCSKFVILAELISKANKFTGVSYGIKPEIYGVNDVRIIPKVSPSIIVHRIQGTKYLFSPLEIASAAEELTSWLSEQNVKNIKKYLPY